MHIFIYFYFSMFDTEMLPDLVLIMCSSFEEEYFIVCFKRQLLSFQEITFTVMPYFVVMGLFIQDE